MCVSQRSGGGRLGLRGRQAHSQVRAWATFSDSASFSCLCVPFQSPRGSLNCRRSTATRLELPRMMTKGTRTTPDAGVRTVVMYGPKLTDPVGTSSCESLIAAHCRKSATVCCPWARKRLWRTANGHIEFDSGLFEPEKRGKALRRGVGLMLWRDEAPSGI